MTSIKNGDLDLLVGDELGLLHLYINSAGPGAWPIWELETLGLTDGEGTTIDVGQFAAPQWVDVDEDGLLDIVIGEKNGTLSLYLGCGDENASPHGACSQARPLVKIGVA